MDIGILKKSVFLIVLITTIAIVCITQGNMINLNKENTQKKTREIQAQNKSIDKLRNEIAEAIASKAADRHMVKIPVRELSDVRLPYKDADISLASIK